VPEGDKDGPGGAKKIPWGQLPPAPIFSAPMTGGAKIFLAPWRRVPYSYSPLVSLLFFIEYRFVSTFSLSISNPESILLTCVRAGPILASKDHAALKWLQVEVNSMEFIATPITSNHR